MTTPIPITTPRRRRIRFDPPMEEPPVETQRCPECPERGWIFYAGRMGESHARRCSCPHGQRLHYLDLRFAGLLRSPLESARTCKPLAASLRLPDREC